METNFKKFIEEIKLTSNQEEDALRKYSGVCEVLHAAYYPNTIYDGSTKLLIGSYGKSTNIRPPRDIDVIFKMPPEQFTRFDNLKGNKQSQLLQEIRQILMDSYPTTETISAWEKIVQIEFAEGTHNVELLPAWELPEGKFRIPNSVNSGTWEIIMPHPELKNVSDSNQRTGCTLSLIRICKKWAEHCNVEIRSFIIELLVINYLNTLNEDVAQPSFAYLTAGFFKYLLTQVNLNVLRPNGDTFSLGNKWQTKAETASQRADKALVFELDGKFDESADEWKKIFGDDFPKLPGANKVNLLNRIPDLQAKYPSPFEKFLVKDFNIPVELNPNYKIKIDARVTQDGFRVGFLSDFLRKKYLLKKRKKLLFTIIEKQLPSNYEVMWKVRNFGDEASKENQLRGEISKDLGKEERVETTKYNGEHYVECYIIKDRKCVAFDRILVPIGTNY